MATRRIEGVLVGFYPKGPKIEIVIDLQDGRRIVEECEVADGLVEWLATKVGKPIDMRVPGTFAERK